MRHVLDALNLLLCRAKFKLELLVDRIIWVIQWIWL
jgi:hypothetical protein